MTTKKIAGISLMTALAVILALIMHFPIFPAATFLEYDLADVPIFISTFAFGPAAGFITALLACIIQGTTVSASGGIIGILMHLLATGGFTIVAGLIYKFRKTTNGLIISCVIGDIVWIGAMIFFNIFLTPIFMGTPREAVIAMLLPIILPFNLIKAVVNTLIALLLYMTLKPHIDRYLSR